MYHKHGAVVVVLAAVLAQNSTACPPTPPRVPVEKEIDRVTPDPVHRGPNDYFKDFKIEKSDLLKILRDYDVIPEREWLHNYSHVAFGDRTGTITLRDGTKFKYMVRPGGLATLTFPDGQKLFLACPPLKPRQR